MSSASPVELSVADQVARANASGRTPVVFVHGLWLLPSSWDRWAEVFEAAGYAPLSAGLAGRSRDGRGGQRPSRGLRRQDGRPGRRPLRRRHRPARRASRPSIGHSFGGLLTQIIAGRGLVGRLGGDRPRAVPRRAAAADLGAALGVPGARQPGQPQPRGAADLRPVPLRVRQRGRARTRPRSSTRPTRCRRSGAPLFQAATANLNPWTEAKVDTENPDARPAADHLRREGPHGAAGRSPTRRFKQQQHNDGVDRDRRDRGPRPRADDRQRLARGRRHGAALRAAVRVNG